MRLALRFHTQIKREISARRPHCRCVARCVTHRAQRHALGWRKDARGYLLGTSTYRENLGLTNGRGYFSLCPLSYVLCRIRLLLTTFYVVSPTGSTYGPSLVTTRIACGERREGYPVAVLRGPRKHLMRTRVSPSGAASVGWQDDCWLGSSNPSGYLPSRQPLSSFPSYWPGDRS